MPQFPSVAAFELFPDWVCEVLSPATERVDRVLKMPIYAREGVGHMWLVDPIVRTVEVFRLQGAEWLLAKVVAGDERVRLEPFGDVEIDLGRLWIPQAAHP